MRSRTVRSGPFTEKIQQRNVNTGEIISGGIGFQRYLDISQIADRYLDTLYVDHVSYMGANPGITTTNHFNDLYDYDFENYIPVDLNPDHLAPQRILRPPDGDPWMTQLLAKTNPSRPLVSLPAFAGELFEQFKGVPNTLKDKGSLGFGEARKSELGIRFGVLPFVSDVMKLTRLSENVDKRRKELVRLGNNGGARVKRTLSKQREVKVVPADVGRDPYFRGLVSKTTIQTIYGTTRWIPGPDAYPFTGGGTESRAAIRNLLLGISSKKNIIGYAADAWELLPWSWMADWCGNTGDYLQATENTNISFPLHGYIMCRTETITTWKGNERSITMKHVTKTRVPASPSLSVSAPVISADRMLILIGLTERYRSRSHSGSGGGNPPLS